MLALIVPVKRNAGDFLDKPLYPVLGIPLVIRVANHLRDICPDIPLHFAVDDRDIQKLLEQNGFSAILTNPNLSSGSDRAAEVNRRIGARHVITCPGDEPAIERAHIDLLADALKRGAPMTTLAITQFSQEDFSDTRRTKVVVGASGNALYFSRTGIPYDRATNGNLPPLAEGRGTIGLHQGLYGYSADMLERFAEWIPTPLEQAEGLEQLRVLENGYPIQVHFNSFPLANIETQEDVAAYENGTWQSVGA
jgi:3-deoxy-manno-octulosonate cytidylyltransferase (CMP-KDO synthetase)